MAKAKKTADESSRLPVQKTCKLYIGGQFPRTESGRYYTPIAGERSLGNICLASRKDFRDAVVAARVAQTGWAGKSAFNRSQILYRIAELLEGRRSQFIDELILQSFTKKGATTEVDLSIDRLIYYAGWCDKFQQVFGCVNPVATSHFNFSIFEPTGVVAMIASQTSPLLGLVSLVAPVIASGNTCVVLASKDKPLSAVAFAEVLHTSDVPGGVVNLLTGDAAELSSHFATHMDVNAVAIDSKDESMINSMQELSAGNVKRFRNYQCDWTKPENQNPYLIEAFCEVKTTWHPIEQIGVSGSVY